MRFQGWRDRIRPMCVAEAELHRGSWHDVLDAKGDNDLLGGRRSLNLSTDMRGTVRMSVEKMSTITRDDLSASMNCLPYSVPGTTSQGATQHRMARISKAATTASARFRSGVA